ncbi:hypothetical protein Vadar_022006 [Vaccinium darrowii]|uniref:Uncharacterized protein n=1 Tax=Vaccinium darrowii TaxID=229202 RepID=A0ACB7YGE2_9ERIC|nr:hypothetical protein Vadar_022006 [Vaccinium darrowii]
MNEELTIHQKSRTKNLHAPLFISFEHWVPILGRVTNWKKVILKVQPILEEILKKVYTQLQGECCMRIADIGCSSGPNTFLVISEIIETLRAFSDQSQYCKASELQIYLNDLPENDFNAIFKLLPSFYKKLKKDYEEKGEDEATGPANCFIMGVPGSFYCRLFPSNNLHFVHSSYSLHWLSQVPKNLQNPRNIYISKTGPSTVFEAYLKQFQDDFSTFLRCRSMEMVVGGGMILTFVCRSGEDPTCGDSCTVWDLLTKSLLDLVSEGLIQEKDVDSFNIPIYVPYKDEVKAAIEKEESFNLETLDVFERNSDPKEDEDMQKSGKNIASDIRAITEPMLASHFGDLFDLYEKFAKHLAEHLCHQKAITITTLVVSLLKK